MNTLSFYKITFRTSLITAGFMLGLGINFAIADSDDASKPKAHSDGIEATVSDAAITTKMRAKLMSEDGLKQSNVSVTTTNGVVTLDGTASDAKAKSFAGKEAKSIDGVKSVDNNLKTPGSSKELSDNKQDVSDSWITTKVKSEILADSVSKGFDVNVVTTDGVVVLQGFLANQDAIDHVKDIAGKVNGVKGVSTSNLIVAKK